MVAFPCAADPHDEDAYDNANIGARGAAAPLAHHMWVFFCHVITHREQGTIFGPAYGHIPTLLGKCAAAAADYAAGKAVGLNLDRPCAGSELTCTGAGVYGLAAGIVLVGDMAMRAAAEAAGPSWLAAAAAAPPAVAASLAGAAAMHAAAEQTKGWASAAGVPLDRLLLYVVDVVGPAAAVAVVAVEATGGNQRGVAHLGYSAWAAVDEGPGVPCVAAGEGGKGGCGGSAIGALVSVAATVGQLRAAGRAGTGDNVLAAPPPAVGEKAMERRLLVPTGAEEGEELTAVPYVPGGADRGRLDDGAVVR